MRTTEDSTQSVVTLRQRRVTALSRLLPLPREMFDVEVFIEAVKQRPGLYNTKHQNYNRKDLRARLWSEIGRIMYADWDSLDARDRNEKCTFMQKKWKSLKDCFNREIRLQKARDSNRLRKKYEFFDRLSFLLLKNNPEVTKPTGLTNQVRVKEEKSENPETRIRTATQSLHPPLQEPITNQSQNEIRITEGNLKKRKMRSEEISDRDYKSKHHRRAEGAEDSDRLFLMSFVGDFKKLPMATRYWVKMKFSEIMHQAAMSLDGYQEAEYASPSIEYDQEVGSPVSGCLDGGNSPDSSSSQIYDVGPD